MRATRLLLLALPALAACELTEVETAVAEDVVIAEVVLRAGETRQTAYLHRTTTGRSDARVLDATIEVRAQGVDEVIVFEADEDSVCLVPAPTGPHASLGTCYSSRRNSPPVRPGMRYRLQIDLSDGRRMTGSTQVPGGFRIVQPAADVCRLDPNAAFDIVWTRSAGASVYIGETSLPGLQNALRAQGVAVEGEKPIYLTGLAIGAADTTMLFPGDFGVFDRFDADLHPVLVAIRDGLPPGVLAGVDIAAADLNYVNWVRGGTFNPSGTVRVPSIYGGGTGVFGSLVVRGLSMWVHPPGDGAEEPACVGG